MKQRLIFIAGLTTLIVAVHLPALRAGFVWDDTALVLRDPLIRSWRLLPEGFQHYLFVDATPSNFFRPLQRLTYTFEYWGFGFQPLPYHATNILLHVVAALALFFFALALLEHYSSSLKPRMALAAIVVLAWGVHPAHAAVVDYVAGRADSLAAIFGFAGLYVLIRASAVKGREVWKYYALAGALLLGAALSKESGLIFIAIAIAFLTLGQNKSALVPAAVAIAFIATIYLSLRFQTEPVQVPRLSPPPSLLVRPIIAARALAEYTSLFLFPVNLHVERDVESHPWGFSPESLTATSWRELETLAGILLFGLLLLWIIRAHRRQPLVFLLLVFAVISYVPISGLFTLNATVAEHWIYVPSAIVLLATAVQIACLIRERADWVRIVAIATAFVWMTFLGVQTFSRASDWKNQRTFLERTIAAGGNSTRMLINLGGLEMSEGNFKRAETLLTQALAKEPGQPFALLNLAAIAIHNKDFVRARNFIDRALTNPITAAQAQEMLATLEREQQGYVDLARLRLASRTAPLLWSVERDYVRALGATGLVEEAIAELQSIVKTDWYRAESWQLLWEYLRKSGRYSEADEARRCAYEYDVHLRNR